MSFLEDVWVVMAAQITFRRWAVLVMLTYLSMLRLLRAVRLELLLFAHDTRLGVSQIQGLRF